MDAAILAVRAAAIGVKPEVYERMETFGITEEDAKTLKGLSVEGLRGALAANLTIDKILQLAKDRTIYDDSTLQAYALLVRQLSDEQLASLDNRKQTKVHEFLRAGFSTDDAIALSQHGGFFDVKGAVAARKHGIPVSDLVEAWAVRYDSSYVEARRAGVTHTELLEVLRLTESFATDFGLSNYITVTGKGVATHEQIVAMLRAYTAHMRRYYVEFVLGTKDRPDTVTHSQAMEILASKYSYPSDYWEARRVASHSEVIEIATAGMSAREYVPLRENNPRVTHGEIVQLASLGGRASELPLFIRLIDGNYPYDGIRASGMSVSDYHYLRASDYGPHLTQQQVLEVKDLPLTIFDYGELRRQGIPHDTIVANASNAQ